MKLLHLAAIQADEVILLRRVDRLVVPPGVIAGQAALFDYPSFLRIARVRVTVAKLMLRSFWWARWKIASASTCSALFSMTSSTIWRCGVMRWPVARRAASVSAWVMTAGFPLALRLQVNGIRKCSRRCAAHHVAKVIRPRAECRAACGFTRVNCAVDRQQRKNSLPGYDAR